MPDAAETFHDEIETAVKKAREQLNYYPYKTNYATIPPAEQGAMMVHIKLTEALLWQKRLIERDQKEKKDGG